MLKIPHGLGPKPLGMANANTQRLQVLDEYKGHAHNAENLIITDVSKEIVRAP